MADITVVAANVRPLPGAQTLRLVSHEALTVGQFVYINSDGEAQLSDADAAASAIVVGVVVSVAASSRTVSVAGEVVDVLWMGRVTGFSGMTPGIHVYVSTTAGAASDARYAGSSGDFVYEIGIALNATDILVRPFADILTAL